MNSQNKFWKAESSITFAEKADQLAAINNAYSTSLINP